VSTWRTALASPAGRVSHEWRTPVTGHEIARDTTQVTASLCRTARPTPGRAVFVCEATA